MPTNDYIKRSDAFKWVCVRCSAAGECENVADPCFVEVSVNKSPPPTWSRRGSGFR
jgi:hypothetical protein